MARGRRKEKKGKEERGRESIKRDLPPPPLTIRGDRR